MYSFSKDTSISRATAPIAPRPACHEALRAPRSQRERRRIHVIRYIRLQWRNSCGHCEKNTGNGEAILATTRGPDAPAIHAVCNDINANGPAIHCETLGHGRGLYAKSLANEAIHGETAALTQAAVAGENTGPTSTAPGVWGKSWGGGPGVAGLNVSTDARFYGVGVLATSELGEGVHAENNSTTHAAIAGIALNEGSGVAAIHGEHRGSGPAIFGRGVVAAEFVGIVRVPSGILQVGNIDVGDEVRSLRLRLEAMELIVRGLAGSA